MFPVYYNDHYVVPLPATHPFPMMKYKILRDQLISSGIIHTNQLRVPALATRDQLLLVHADDYIERVFSGTLSTEEVRRLGFPWSPELVLRARASVGGTIAAARSAFEHGISGSLAGGTHHAHHDFGSGFCVFNDIAVAIKLLQSEELIHKALVIDLDVHQGDGTAEIFRDTPNVFTFSVHSAKNFPGHKAAGDLDIGLDDAIEDAEYLRALEVSLKRVLECSDPDMIFYQAGVDALGSDKWGRFKL